MSRASTPLTINWCWPDPSRSQPWIGSGVSSATSARAREARFIRLAPDSARPNALSQRGRQVWKLEGRDGGRLVIRVGQRCGLWVQEQATDVKQRRSRVRSRGRLPASSAMGVAQMRWLAS